jgi:beta-glucanase (GH16 family)
MSIMIKTRLGLAIIVALGACGGDDSNGALVGSNGGSGGVLAIGGAGGNSMASGGAGGAFVDASVGVGGLPLDASGSGGAAQTGGGGGAGDREGGADGGSLSIDSGNADGSSLPADSGNADASVCPNGFGGPPTSTSPPIAGTWTIAFQDDFVGDVLDDSKWKLGENWAGINGIGANAPENMSIACGYLTFLGEKRSLRFAGKDYAYASGEISTFKRFRQKYGFFELRAKIDPVRGLWPAFWLMPDRGLYGNVDDDYVSYLKFDLTGENRPSVASATLELHVDSAQAGTQNVVLLGVIDDNWSEGSVTYASRPKVDPLFVQMKYDPKWVGGETAAFDVTDWVNRELAGDKVASFALADTFNRAQRVSFNSRESATSAYRPRLVLAGAAAPIVAAADAAVRAGTHAAENLGTQPLLSVAESWADTTSTYNGGMEFDVMETLGTWGMGRTSHTLHWDGYGADHKSQGSGTVSFPATGDGFHVYGLDWQPGKTEFYVDGKKTWELADARVGSVEEYMILSLQMGGWSDSFGDNTKPDDAKLPGRMLVDYVRVWSGAPN